LKPCLGTSQISTVPAVFSKPRPIPSRRPSGDHANREGDCPTGKVSRFTVRPEETSQIRTTRSFCTAVANCKFGEDGRLGIENVDHMLEAVNQRLKVLVMLRIDGHV